MQVLERYLARLGDFSEAPGGAKGWNGDCVVGESIMRSCLSLAEPRLTGNSQVGGGYQPLGEFSGRK